MMGAGSLRRTGWEGEEGESLLVRESMGSPGALPVTG